MACWGLSASFRRPRAAGERRERPGLGPLDGQRLTLSSQRLLLLVLLFNPVDLLVAVQGPAVAVEHPALGRSRPVDAAVCAGPNAVVRALVAFLWLLLQLYRTYLARKLATALLPAPRRPSSAQPRHGLALVRERAGEALEPAAALPYAVEVPARLSPAPGLRVRARAPIRVHVVRERRP